MRRLTAAVLVAALAAFGCSDDEASTASTEASGGTTSAGGNGGTGASGGNGSGGDMGDPPDWSCLGNVTLDPPTSPTIAYNISYEDFITGDPLTGRNLVAKACARGDQACTTPLDEQMADENATINLTLPTGTNGFDGYIEVTGDGVGWLNFFHRPLIEDEEYSEGIVTESGLITLATLLSTTPDDADGDLLFAVADCGPGDPIGAQVSATGTDADTILAYLVGEIPRKDVDVTDQSGFGGYVNVPPGDVTITATVAETSEQIASADVFVKAGFTSFVFLPPSP